MKKIMQLLVICIFTFSYLPLALCEPSEGNVPSIDINSNYNKLEKELQELRQELKVETDKYVLLNKQSEHNLDFAGKIIDWSGVLLTLLVIILAVAGWVGTRRLNEIDKTSEALKDLLASMDEQHLKMLDLGKDTEISISRLRNGFEKDRKDLMEIFLALRDGEVAYESGEATKAVKIYSRVLTISPEIPEANYMLGNSYSAEGNYIEAIKFLKKAIEVKNNYHEAYYNLGRTYRRNGDYELAIEALLRSNEIDPYFPAATENIGHVYLEMNKLDEALVWYKKTVRIDPKKSAAFICMGRIFHKTGLIDKALNNYKKTQEINEEAIKNGTARYWDYYQLGEAFLVQNIPEQSKKYFDKAYALNAANGTLLAIVKGLSFLKNSKSTIDQLDEYINFFTKELNNN